MPHTSPSVNRMSFQYDYYCTILGRRHVWSSFMDDRIQLIEFLISDCLSIWSKDQGFDESMSCNWCSFLMIFYSWSIIFKRSIINIASLLHLELKFNILVLIIRHLGTYKIILSITSKSSSVYNWGMINDNFMAVLFEEWVTSIFHARKALELLESRNGLYVLYMDRVTGELGKQVGQVPSLQKMKPDILDKLLCWLVSGDWWHIYFCIYSHEIWANCLNALASSMVGYPYW